MRIKIKTQSDIRVNPLKDKCRMSMILERESFDKLKEIAVNLNTTCNEIVRSLVDEFVNNTDMFLCDSTQNNMSVKRLDHW